MLDVVSLGMLTIDDLVYADDSNGEAARKDDLLGILGGAGTYAVLGARLMLPADEAYRAGWIIHKGHDFPQDMLEVLKSWQTTNVWIATPERRTTRARNTYNGDLRHFEFLTSKIQVDHTMLTDELLDSASFHIIGTPERCITCVHGIRARRRNAACAGNPHFVWEPMEHSCSKENLHLFIQAMKLVQVFSPNEDEFCKLLGLNLSEGESLSDDMLEKECRAVQQHTPQTSIVVRLGSNGAFIAQSDKYTRLPAYHHSTAGKVVDVTGGGNAFLGGFCVGMLKQRLRADLTVLESAAAYGAVAASFAIEQIGMPMMDHAGHSNEQWNGQSVPQRLREYLSSIVKQAPAEHAMVS